MDEAQRLPADRAEGERAHKKQDWIIGGDGRGARRGGV
jgi:hypothetical protein